MEIWESVIGWKGLYAVSSLGRIRSIERKTVHKNGFVQTIKEKILSGTIAKNGYRYVDLRKPGMRKNAQVHRLVMLAFIGKCPDGHEARHKDGNRLNNCVSNLKYGTRQDNVDDTKRHGKIPAGDNHWNVKIPDSEIYKIRRSREAISVLAERYGATWTTIYDIKNRRRRCVITP